MCVSAKNWVELFPESLLADFLKLSLSRLPEDSVKIEKLKSQHSEYSKSQYHYMKESDTLGNSKVCGEK